jgi:hypothetical protein
VIIARTEKNRQRLVIALKWADFAEESRDQASALRALVHAVELLPWTAFFEPNISRQMDLLKESCGLSCRAATVALSAGQVQSAVELLERGRGVIWSQYSYTRCPMGVFIPVPEEIRVAKHDMLEWTESHQKRAQLQEALHELRALPRYERFLVPPSFQDICDNISEGYIALLVPSKDHCDVILLSALGTSPHHLRLPSLNMQRLQDMASTLTEVTTTYRDSVGSFPRKMKKVFVTAERPNSAYDSGISYNKLLAELWTSLVKPIVERLRIPVSMRASLTSVN